MKKKLNNQYDNNQAENLINFLSNNKLLSLIAAKKIFKNVTRRPLRTVAIAVIIGYVAFIFIEKAKVRSILYDLLKKE